jgi:hypothetical protein
MVWANLMGMANYITPKLMANQNNTTKLRKDLEEHLRNHDRLEEENKYLKILLYRMVATHGNEIDPVGYLPRKGAKIHEMNVRIDDDGIKFSSSHTLRHIPNNSEAEV